MNDSSPKRSDNRMLSDDQMNGALKNFFRLETPAELNQPFSVAELKKSRAASVADTDFDSISTSKRAVETQPSRRFIVSSVLATLAMALVVYVSTKNDDSGNTSTAEGRPAQKSPVDSGSDLMNVSPQGDLKGSGVPVGEDGVTLEETDKIELKP